MYQYKHPFGAGSTHVVLEPLDFMYRMYGMPRAQGCARAAIARLAALVPIPRLNLTRFHGVFAPNCKHWARVVPGRRKRAGADQPLAPMTWMQRLKRVFAIDMESCPDCGGRLCVIACIEDPPLIRKILAHVHRRESLTAIAARGPPADPQQVLNLS